MAKRSKRRSVSKSESENTPPLPPNGATEQPAAAPQAAANVTTFTPSAKQQEFLELLQSQRDPSSLRHLCSLGVVTRTTLYRWQKDPAFNAWLGREALQHLCSHNSILLITSMNAALQGDERMATLLLKFLLNPKGMPALANYLNAPSAAAPGAGAPAPAAGQEPELADESRAAHEPEPAPQPAATGVIGSTFRALLSVENLIGESDLRAAKRSEQFAKSLFELQRYANLEKNLLRQLSPPGLFDQTPLMPSRSEITDLARLRQPDFASHCGNPPSALHPMQFHHLLYQCRADLIAARAGHVCHDSLCQPASIPELKWKVGDPMIWPHDHDEDTRPIACEHPDPPSGPTCLEFLDAFRRGDLETARRGLEAGLPIHLRSTNNLTPFTLAARNQQIEMFEFAVRAAALVTGESAAAPPDTIERRGPAAVPDFDAQPVRTLPQ